MKRKAAFLAIAFLTLLGAPGTPSGHPAVVVVDLVWKHIGGKENFEQVRYVSFTWGYEKDGGIVSSRDHVWDRHTGNYVCKFEERESGDNIEVQFNIDTKEGVALRNGAIVEGEDAMKLIESAHGAFINDTYWLLAPAKLNDYGIRLKYVGHEVDGEIEVNTEVAHSHEHHDHNHEVDERDPDEPEPPIVLHARFENVGLTPGDQYWFYVTHGGQILRWRYVLESGREGDWDWTDEKDVGMGIKLSTRKVNRDGTGAIVFPNVNLSTEVAPDTFQYLTAP